MKNNYVLIISSEDDISTNYVISWINYLGGKVIRVNDTNSIQVVNISINNNKHDFIFSLNGCKLRFSEVKSFWYRRGELKVNIPFSMKDNLKSTFHQYLNTKVSTFLSYESKALSKYFDLVFQSKKHINYVEDNYTNKLNNLNIAASLGLTIPETSIISKKKDLLIFKNKFKDGVITKGIYSSFEFLKGNHLFVNMTEKFDIDDNLIPKEFAPTLFQEFIKKRLELRIFFFNNQYFSAAIFTQKNKNTIVDSKLEDINFPNRIVPFNLPKNIQMSLSLFTEYLGINSGSIDMILTPKNKYVFLEINPIGQFAQISKYCNYKLHKLVAKYLLNEN